jgi:predicted TIM-barrel fold metal-dependent hydrolase
MSTTTSESQYSVPSGAWDSHMHVCEPSLFPLSASAKYQPHAATLTEAHTIIGTMLGLRKLVFVQPSTYGNDNACLLDALAKVGPSMGRGVVVFDPASTSLEQLKKWHEIGVRGVRVNLKSISKVMEPEEFQATLLAYAKAIRPMKTWVLQLYVDLAMMKQVEPLMGQLDVKVVIDHFGSPEKGRLMPAGKLSEMQGWDSLLAFMKYPNAFVKISGPYRFSNDPEFKDMEPLAKELFAIRGGKGCVFASDWPHTRYESIDISPWVDRCVEWCGSDTQLLESLFRNNAEELWDV